MTETAQRRAKMTFEWNRMYKWEETHEHRITEDVEEYICNYYNVSSFAELTQEQVDEINVWRTEQLHDLNIMQVGFSNLMSYWEDAQES